MKFKVPIFGASNKFAWLNEKATEGAQVGVNLLGPDGKLVSADAWQKLLAGGTQAPSSGPNTTDDVNEGRFNLYFTKQRARDAVGEILANSANVTLAYAGNPKTIKADLTDVSLSAGGALKKYGFDAKGRLAKADDATTDDLTEGEAHLYYTDARAQAACLAPTRVAAGQSWTLPADMQAAIHAPILLEGDAELHIEGTLFDLTWPSLAPTPPKIIKDVVCTDPDPYGTGEGVYVLRPEDAGTYLRFTTPGPNANNYLALDGDLGYETGMEFWVLWELDLHGQQLFGPKGYNGVTIPPFFSSPTTGRKVTAYHLVMASPLIAHWIGP